MWHSCAWRSSCTIAQRIRNQLQRKCRGYGGVGAFCPASAWITESRSRQIQLKFEVRFACSPQCSSLLQHVAHGRLHRWHCRQCCTWPIVALHFCLPPLNGKFKFISGFNCGNATTPTHIHTEWVWRLCAGHVCGNKCPVSVSTRAVPRYVLGPRTDLPKQLCMKKKSACPLIKIVRAR